MRCIRVSAPKEPLVFLNKEPVPTAPEGGAVVKISYSGVCHSDVQCWQGDFSFKYPGIPGHEIAGVVFSMKEGLAKTKADEAGVKVGDRVVVFPWINCNSCRPCTSGLNNYCNGSVESPVSIGFTQDGGFAEYVSVPDLRYLVPFPESIPSAIACLLPCGGLTAYHAVEEGIEFVKTVTEIKNGCSVLVIGAGGLGQWGLRLAKALYPPETQIMGADVRQEALDSVVSNVKDVTPLLLSRDQSSEQTTQQVKAASYAGDGVDLVLDFVGVTQTFEAAIKSLRKRGRYHVIGLLGGIARLPLEDIVGRGIVMKGIPIGTLVQLKRLMKPVTNIPAVYADLQYTVHPLEDGIQVLEKLARGEVTGRAVLRCEGDDWLGPRGI